MANINNNQGHHYVVYSTTAGTNVSADPSTIFAANVNKCAKFFKSLLKLSHQQPPPKDFAVRQYIRDILSGNMTAQEFSLRIQDTLKSEPNRSLVPFLQTNLPRLRNILNSAEGIHSDRYPEVLQLTVELNSQPPSASTTQYVLVSGGSSGGAGAIHSTSVFPNSPPVYILQPASSQSPMDMTMSSMQQRQQGHGRMTPATTASGLYHHQQSLQYSAQQRPISRTHAQLVAVTSSGSLQNGGNGATTQSLVQNRTPTPSMLHSFSGSPATSYGQQLLIGSGTSTNSGVPSPFSSVTTASSSISRIDQCCGSSGEFPQTSRIKFQSSPACGNVPSPGSKTLATAATSSLDAIEDSIEGVVKGLIGGTNTNTNQHHSSADSHHQPVITTGLNRPNSQPGSGPSSVCPNSRPSQQHLVQLNLDPEKAGYMLVNPQAIVNRILKVMPETDRIDQDVLSMISEAVEAKLRTIISRLSVIAEHRLEPLRANPAYRQIDDPRKQIRFVEEVEKSAFLKRKENEKEALLRMTKTKSKDKDTRDKVREMQRADREATANRETNAAAFAALGGMRAGVKRAADANGLSQNGVASSQFGQGLPSRNRIKRITMKDLQYLVNNDRTLSLVSPQIRHRIVLATLNMEDSSSLV